GDEENFQHSAFELPLTPHSNFYSTGDLARWLSDGNIEFLGRIDNQVKIRGFRIELGEIENQLLKHKYIKEAVVILNNDAITDKNLTAYIVSIEAFHENELREYLQKNLPDYMIPSYFVQLEKIPLTPNGKVDRKVLPEPRMKAGKSYIAPGNEIEKKLVEIWSEVLGRDELHIIQLNETIGINDNFFQLGGHSLKATILSAKIHKAFNANIPLSKIFTIPTIRGLANYIKSALQEKYLTIESIEKKEYYSLSSAQKRLYILYQMNPQGIGYNIPSFLVLEGAIDKEKLEHTFKLMIRRHESLRTSFHMINDEPVQRIHDKVEFEIEYLATEAFIRPFDLSNAPLLRVGLIKENENKHILMMDMHHIISDGTSINIMVKDFMALYQGEFPSELQIQYKDFSNWQNDEKQAESLERQGEFWLNEFAGEIPVLELPVDYPRPAVQSFEGSSIPFEIDKETVGVLKTLALELGATIYMILLSLYTVFLAKLTNQEDIVIGSPIAGRRHVDLEKIIGMFVNTLALRNYPLGEKLFIYFLEEVKEKTLAAFNNQEYPYEDMVEQVATSVNRDTARNPLFDTMFALQNIKGGVIEIPGLKIEPYVFENKTAKFDLTLTAVESEDELELTFAYSTQLFKRETIQRFINYFINAAAGVTGVMKDKTLRIGDISIISTQEKNRILYDFNNTAREYSVHKTLSQWFDEQVERTPESIAVVGPGFSDYPVYLAYKELSGLARRLAYVLQAKGMNSAVNPIVPIMMERTVEMIVGIWGILKAGGAFLPIDPHSPEDRIKYMLEDSGTKLLAVANSQEGKKVRRWKGEKVLLESIIDSLNHLPYHHSTFDIPRIQHSNHLCYIIYTSGSTGRPKGVMIEHGNLVNLVEGLNQSIYSRYHQELNVSLVSPFVFDASIKQIFGALLLGHALHIIPEAIRFNGKSLLDYLIKYKIDVSDGTPSHLRLLIENITAESLPVDIKLFIIGGEALSRDIAGSFFNKFSCQAPGIINIYGPTECTVDTTYFELNNENHQHLKTNIAIGKPLANYSVYIVDSFKRLQPVGTAGELLVGGKGVGRGYLNNPELTNDRFILTSGTGATGNPFEKGFLDFPKLLPNYQSPFTTH
ncbi:MAG TPA: condensation domain-containing protein, partial [Candidatus Kapabacteria bacterium]|nr:condensation domain-containing protein [Candidatus Kapabacteria bacterium]